MKNEPLVSVIMPVYNSEKFVEQAVESVIKQTYRQWELIIINDSSTDNTRKVICNLAQKDERIRFYENEVNIGVSKTRNKAVNLARGEWVAFLDSDDMWAEEKLQHQMELIDKQNNVQLVFSGSAFVNENGKMADYVLHVPERIGYKDLLKQNLISCSSVLVKKEYVKKYVMPGDKLHEDYTVWLRILQNEEYAYGIDEPLLIYRMSSNSRSSNKIEAAKMQYRVYQYMGLNQRQRFFYMFCYAFRNIKKYRNIYKSI